jgi:hypothetical protein
MSTLNDHWPEKKVLVTDRRQPSVSGGLSMHGKDDREKTVASSRRRSLANFAPTAQQAPPLANGTVKRHK